MDEKIKKAAEQFGKALADSALMQEYRQSEEELESDTELLRLKAEVDQVYDELTQRQSAGEVVPRGEIEAYYDMEQAMISNPLLMRRASSLERLKDFYSETNQILSGKLGINLVDLIKP
jgi:hypothetical protein